MACWGSCEASPLVSRCIYLALYVLWFTGAWLCRAHANNLVSDMYWYKSCQGSEACISKQSVLRVSCGCFIFHLLLLSFTLGVKHKSDPRCPFHNGLWHLKVLAAIGCFFLPFAFPSIVISGYVQLARVLSGFFLLLQLILLLDTMFTVNGFLIDRRRCIPLLLGFTALAFAAWIVGLVYAFKIYVPDSSCGMNIGWIVCNMVLGLAIVVVSIQPYRLGSSGLLTAGMVVAYCVFLLIGAMSSAPSPCNRTTANADTTLRIVSFIIVGLALLSATFNSSAGTDRLGLDVERQEDATEERLPYRPDAFHLMYALSACYMGMLLLNWQLRDGSSSTWEIDRGYASAWIKFASMLLCMGLYTWVLLAPHILPERQFVL